MKKIISFLFATISIFLLNIDSVYAAEKVKISFDYQSNVYYTRKGDGLNDSHQYLYYNLNGVPAFCIEPGVDINDWDYLVYGIEKSPFDAEKTHRLQLIGHYGYDYPGHQTQKYRMATQKLIWETSKNLKVEYYTKVNGGGTHIDISNEVNEILRLVDSHYTKPSFDGTTINTTYNSQTVLDDANSILSDYEIYDDGGNNISISNNKLYITPKTMNSSTIILKKKLYDSATTIIYVGENGKSQKLGRFRATDPVLSRIALNTTGGTISINKVDSETGQNIPQGSAELSGSVFGIYDEENNLITSIATDKNGKATSSFINKMGTFKIKELNSPQGYLINNNEFTATISDNNLDPIVNVSEQVIKGKVKITKYDADNNSCNPQGSAKLKSAKYGIYNSNNNLVETLTVGDDCTATSNNLVYGKYKVKEIEASDGYQLDSTTYNVNIDSNNETENVVSHEKVIKGKVKITKYDADNNSCNPQGEGIIKGAKYGLYNTNNELVETLTIDNNCSAISSDLPYGKYTIKEIEAPNGYEIDKNIYVANIIKNETINITSKENIIKGKIKINKIDKDNNSCNPQGEGELSGSVFEIKDINNIVVDTLTINENCSAISKNLPYGKYTIKEKSSGKGYYLNDNTFNININEKNDYNITVSNEVIKNEFIINKFYGNQSTGFIYSEANAIFEIKDSSNNVFDTITTNSQGTANITLPYGSYKVKQIKGLEEYKMMDTFDIDVNETSLKTQIKNIKNGEITAKLKVIKIDADTKEQINIKGFKFKIKNTDTNDFVCQTTDKVICEYETNEEGILITPLPLFGGNYELIEIESKPNYLLSDEKIKFKINDDTEFKEDLIFGNIVEIKYENKEVKGTVEVYKNGEVFNGNNISLNNVKFGLYKSDDTLIKEITTDINGYFKIENLSLGKYYIKELECPSKYILDDKKYEFELAYHDDKTPIVYKEFTINNYLKKGDLEFSKTDLATSEGIPNTIIEIYNDNTNEIIFTKTTDKNGKVTIKNLPIGKYYIKEKEAATGYLISNEKVSFEIKENGEIVKAKMTNKKITSTLEITKTDISTDEPLPNTLIEIYTNDDKLLFSEKTDEEGKIIIPDIPYGDYYFIEKEAPIGYVINDEKMYFKVREDGEIIKSTIQDRKIIGGIEITKIDVSTDEPLPNTLFEIYNENNELLFSERTDELGKVYIPELSYGTYYILEKEAPDGYLLNDEKMYFEIKIDGEIVKATITDEKIIIEVPKTDQNKDYKLILYASIILLLGIGIVLYGKNKNKKKK